VDKAALDETTPPMDAALSLRTSSLIAAMGNAEAGATVSFDDLLDGFRQRAFGALLLVVLLPTFIPVPVGIGAITGPVLALIGLQMLLLQPHPWLPRWMGRRTLKRATIKRFGDRFRRLLGWLERVCKPRLATLIEHRAANAFTGLQLVVLGALLALPIPFTNYPFGIILLAYCIALIERDGVVMLIAWTFGLGAIVASALLSGEVVALVGKLFG
jgi:hypothetical protein